VGIISPGARFTPQPSEVEEVFEASISHLTDPANRSTQIRQYKGHSYKDRRFKVGQRVIWGVTGRIVHGFLESLEQVEG